MKIMVCGSRNITDKKEVFKILDYAKFRKKLLSVFEV